MSDLVERKDVLGIVKGMLFAIRMNKEPYSFEEMMELIDNRMGKIKELPSKNQWIPCKDRLPKHGEEVIVSYYDFTSTAQWNNIDKTWYEGFYSPETGDVFCDIHEEVFAWMRLPEAWEGAKNG